MKERKDRLIQARVPKTLESVLKEEASRQRLSVSHLIRNILEDTFNLMDGVVVEVDNLVGDSMDLAMQVGEDTRRIARAAKRGVDGIKAAAGTKRAQSPEPEESPAPEESEAGEEQVADPLAHVLAWNPVVLNREAQCARCGDSIPKGNSGNLGVSQDPSAAPTWLCTACIDTL